jgi:hypothetical protein
MIQDDDTTPVEYVLEDIENAMILASLYMYPVR